MPKFVVKYKVVGGSSGDKVVEADSASEARQMVKEAVQHYTPGKDVQIIEVKKR